MLGNDIVDLQVAKIESNWRRKNYLQKIFSPNEQQYIAEAKQPDEMVWLLWSMKEAAYKIYNRQTGIRSFAPTQLNCYLPTLEKPIDGLVSIKNEIYFTQSQLKDEYIHTLATVNQQQILYTKIKLFEYPENQFDYKSTSPACVSHHGKYLALVYA